MKNRITFYLWRKINSIYYSGDNVECINCSWHGTEFLNGRCPNCNSLPRTRFFAFCIKSYYENYSSLLHVSPNQSEYNFIKNQLNIGKYDRLDKRKISHINLVMDLVENLGITNSYQFIIIWHVLEHTFSHDTEVCLEIIKIKKHFPIDHNSSSLNSWAS